MSGTSQVLTGLVVALVPGLSVKVLCSRSIHNDSQMLPERRQQHLGVDIHRLKATRFGRTRLWGRAIDYASFYLRVLMFLLLNVRRGDVVVLMTDPPLLNLLNTSVVRWRGGLVVNWLQDIFPEIAQRLADMPGPPWAFNFLAAWRDRCLKFAAANVVISPRMATHLAKRGVKNIRTISNWADEEVIAPVAHHDNPLRREWQLEETFAVMYSGNFGRVHAFAEIIEAARRLAHEPGIRFVFIGEGAELVSVRQALQDLPAGQITFKPPQPRSSLAFSLGAADLHLVSLKTGLEDLVMPSKLYSVLAAGRPVAFVGELDGEIAAMIRRENVGFTIAPGDGAGLAMQIRRLASDPVLQETYRATAQALFQKEHSRTQGVAQWRNLLSGLVAR